MRAACNSSLRFSSLVKVNQLDQLASHGYTPPIRNSILQKMFQNLTHSTVCSSLFGEFWNCKFQVALAMARHHGAKAEKPPAQAARESGTGNGSMSQKLCHVLQPRLPKHHLFRQEKNTPWHQQEKEKSMSKHCAVSATCGPGFLLLQGSLTDSVSLRWLVNDDSLPQGSQTQSQRWFRHSRP